MKILLTFIFLLLTSPVWGATYYVKSGGNDSLAGTSDATAWASVDKVEATVTSGDTVYFRSQDTWSGTTGSYLAVLECTAGVTYIGDTYGTGVRATIQVTSGLWPVINIDQSTVTLQGFCINENGLPITGISVGATYGTYNDVDSIVIDNCEVKNGRTTDSGSEYYYGIIVGPRHAYTVSNVTISDCIIHDTGHEGITVYPSWQTEGSYVNGVTVTRCTIYNTGLAGNSRGNCLDLANNADNVTFEYNEISGWGVACVTYNEAIYGVEYDMGCPDNFVFRYNKMETNLLIYGQGGFADSEVAVYGNIFTNSRIALTGTLDSRPFLIYNNTIYNPSSSLNNILLSGTNGGGVVLRNNILYASNAPCLSDTDTLTTHSDNVYYRSSGVLVDRTTDYTSATITTFEASAVSADPLVVSSTNLSLQSGSPCIDTGYDLGETYDDFLMPVSEWTDNVSIGDADLYGAGYEIGAYIYGETATSWEVSLVAYGDITEGTIVSGGLVIQLTVTGTTYNAFDNTIRAAIVAGMDAWQSEATGWDAVVKADIGSWSATGVVRTSDIVCTITLPAFASYAITENELVRIIVPTSALVNGQAIIASPMITISNENIESYYQKGFIINGVVF